MSDAVQPEQPAGKGPLPPVVQLPDFLPAADHRHLLAWVADNHASFAASQILSRSSGGLKSAVNSNFRTSLSNWKLGPWREILEPRLRSALPQIMGSIGYRGDNPANIELEFTAYGDGAFFRPHLDIPVGNSRVPLGYSANEDRVLSAIYYFHNQPRGFSGGQLRLFRMGVDGEGPGVSPGDWADLESTDNQLLVFPSWAMHEVRPVSVPSGEFRDFRYAVNCWFCRPTA